VVVVEFTIAPFVVMVGLSAASSVVASFLVVLVASAFVLVAFAFVLELASSSVAVLEAFGLVVVVSSIVAFVVTTFIVACVAFEPSITDQSVISSLYKVSDEYKTRCSHCTC
jgi:predicted exporter